MRAHTAAHVFAALLCNGTGALVTGNQLDVGKVRFDFSLESFDRTILEKYIDEANRILDKRGFGKERAFLCKWDCLSVNTLISDFRKLLEKIKVSGKNPIYSN